MTHTIAHRETPMDTTADLADVLRTIASGLTVGMPDPTGIARHNHANNWVRLHLRSALDVETWTEWFRRCHAVSAGLRSTQDGDDYRRHARIALVGDMQVELFWLERIQPVARGEYVYLRDEVVATDG